MASKILLISIVAMAAILMGFSGMADQQAHAASMTFETDTTITTDQTIGNGETWTVNRDVTLTLGSGVTVTVENGGIIDTKFNSTITINDGGIINNNGRINNFSTINNNFGGTINNNFDGLIRNNFGIINNNDFGIINNNNGGIINNNNLGIINNGDGGTINNSSVIRNFDVINNSCEGILIGTIPTSGNPIVQEPCDTKAPVITINGDDPVILEAVIDMYAEQGATATDDDPNYSETVVIGGDTVDDTIIGTYIVTYDAPADAAGNVPVQVTRTVSIVEGSFPDDTFVLDGTDSQGHCDAIGTWDQDRLECALTSDVNGRIIIADDGIALDGENDDSGIIHNIIGDGTGIGIRILSGVSDAEIDDIKVSGHGTGILIDGDDSIVRDAMVDNNTDNGIIIDGNYNKVVKTESGGNGENGIAVNGDYNKVEKTESGGNGENGIAVNGYSNKVVKTTSDDNGENGIAVNGDNNKVIDSTASKNTLNGLSLNDSSSDTELHYNIANNNDLFGINKADTAAIEEINDNQCNNNGLGGSNPAGLCTPQA